MSTYAIGDIQGCFKPFMALLDLIGFNAQHDTLWLTGDLVNRGPQSLDVLRYAAALADRHQMVLGNHDLHLLAVSCGAREPHAGDTLQDILAAPDKDELLDWLRHRPMLVQHETLAYVMTHAGLAPSWTLQQAKRLASEVETVLRSKDWRTLFAYMYGNQPDIWSDQLTGEERIRCIINHFTRMRFCDVTGRLDLSSKVSIKNKTEHLIPWFDVQPRLNLDCKIIFGHWAALQGEVDVPNVYALDTGCVWGNQLTAMRLEDGARFAVPCQAQNCA
jgi:bis(5'-nucleosyl)-tetraphosphatase (symmetrical)